MRMCYLLASYPTLYCAMIRAIEREKERNPWLLIDGRMSLMLKRWTFLTQQPERNNCILLLWPYKLKQTISYKGPSLILWVRKGKVGFWLGFTPLGFFCRVWVINFLVLKNLEKKHRDFLQFFPDFVRHVGWWFFKVPLTNFFDFFRQVARYL